MIFIETHLFSKQISQYLTEDEYRELQIYLMEQPSAGAIIQGTGGLRKLRWTLGNKGKRGGIRVIYYWQLAENQIYLMTLYAKNEMENLSSEEKKILKQMIARWKYEN